MDMCAVRFAQDIQFTPFKSGVLRQSLGVLHEVLVLVLVSRGRHTTWNDSAHLDFGVAVASFWKVSAACIPPGSTSCEITLAKSLSLPWMVVVGITQHANFLYLFMRAQATVPSVISQSQPNPRVLPIHSA